MKDKDKTREQLVSQLVELRQRINELEALEGEHRRSEEALRESEEKYRLVVENAKQGIAVVQDGMAKFVNPEIIETSGYSKEELTSSPFLEFIHPDDRAMVIDRYQKRLRGEELPAKYSFRIIAKEGGTRWIESNAVIIESEGRPASLGFVSDITDRKRAEAALRESEAKYRDLAESISDVFFAMDRDLIYTYWNKASEDLTGISAEDAIGKSLLEIFPDNEETRRALRVYQDVLKTQQPQTFTNEYHLGGKKYCFEICAYPSKGGLSVFGRDITDRTRAEEALRRSEERFRHMAELSPFAISIIDPNGGYLYLNQRFVEIFGYTLEDIPNGKEWFKKGYPDPEYRKRAISLWLSDLEESGEYEVRPREFSVTCKDGTVKDVIFRTVTTEDGKQFITYEDITERKRLEQRLLWSQKMETVGRLAGGVAHDFNNMLTAIAGYAELGMMSLHPSDPMHFDLQEILRASERAANLTQQLLAFSRRQIINPKVINPNKILLDMDKMLRRLIGEDIELVTLLADDLGQVKLDPGQIEQVIVNLAVNARDAIPEGGKLTLETANVTLDESHAKQHVGVTPGDYVMLAVRDTGVGMTDEVKEHLFEPFFTTKEVGKGTGLGLATCYGIVKQGGGNIWVYSERNKGTTVKIYLPRADREAEALPMRDESGYLPQGTETVLLAEDELSVRNITARTLGKQGYTVLEAANGDEALLLAQEHDGNEIHLLLTDIVMPQMNGKALAERLRAKRPDMKVLFFSGYTDEAIVHHGILDSGVTFLQKPFSPALLARKVREVLDR